MIAPAVAPIRAPLTRWWRAAMAPIAAPASAPCRCWSCRASRLAAKAPEAGRRSPALKTAAWKRVVSFDIFDLPWEMLPTIGWSKDDAEREAKERESLPAATTLGESAAA